MSQGYDGLLSMDPTLMRQRAQECKDQAAAIQEVIQRVDTTVGALTEEWKGQASLKYFEQWEAVKKQVDEARENLETCSKHIMDVLAASQDLDTYLGSQMGG